MENGKIGKTKHEFETILPNDLLSEILLRLPLKSLGQCKRLSRHWKTQISNRRFIKTRLDKYPKPNNTLILYGASDVSILPCHNGDIDSICGATPLYLSRELTRNSRVVGTQHGLICFSNYITGDACVLNPAMNQMRTFHFNHRSYNRDNTFFGFGFDTINDDYKVFWISTQSEANLTIEICQLRNTETRQIVIPLLQVPFMLCNASTVIVDGSTHWIAFHPKKINLQIVRFDMDLEKFVEIPFSNDMPNINYDANTRGFEGLNLEGLSLEGFNIDGKRFRLGVFKGSLCLFISDSLKVNIWLMKCKKNLDDSRVVWTRMFEIPISRRIEDVVGFTANEEIVIRNENKDYFAYDLWKKRSIFPLGHYKEEIPHQVVAYVDSLVPVFP